MARIKVLTVFGFQHCDEEWKTVFGAVRLGNNFLRSLLYVPIITVLPSQGDNCKQIIFLMLELIRKYLPDKRQFSSYFLTVVFDAQAFTQISQIFDLT